MADVIAPDEFAAAIIDAMQEYAGLIEEDVERVTREVSKETREKIKTNARTKGLVRTGTYLKSWRVKVKLKPMGTAATIYAADPHYRLTHLLEHGHAKVNGGRVPAYPHIGDAERWAISAYQEALREAIESHD